MNLDTIIADKLNNALQTRIASAFERAIADLDIDKLLDTAFNDAPKSAAKAKATPATTGVKFDELVLAVGEHRRVDELARSAKHDNLRAPKVTTPVRKAVVEYVRLHNDPAWLKSYTIGAKGHARLTKNRPSNCVDYKPGEYEYVRQLVSRESWISRKANKPA